MFTRNCLICDPPVRTSLHQMLHCHTFLGPWHAGSRLHILHLWLDTLCCIRDRNWANSTPFPEQKYLDAGKKIQRRELNKKKTNCRQKTNGLNNSEKLFKRTTTKVSKERQRRPDERKVGWKLESQPNKLR